MHVSYFINAVYLQTMKVVNVLTNIYDINNSKSPDIDKEDREKNCLLYTSDAADDIGQV